MEQISIKEIDYVNKHLSEEDIKEINAFIKRKVLETHKNNLYNERLANLKACLENCEGVKRIEIKQRYREDVSDFILYDYKDKKDISIVLGGGPTENMVSYNVRPTYAKSFNNVEEFLKMLPEIHETIDKGVL